MKLKAPAFQWYPGDFRRDTAVQACSFEARALWREMLDLMHDGTPRGFLTAGGVPISPNDLARIVGLSPAKVRRWLAELEQRSVFSRDGDDVIYSRRMVRDEEKRTFQAQCGDASTRPESTKRSGVTGALYNFLLERFKGCLACDGTAALELHRIKPGRHGGKYEPGNVLLLCRDDHLKIGYGELSIDRVLQRHGISNPAQLFDGFVHGRFEGWSSDTHSHTASDTPTGTPQIPSAVALAVASATAETEKRERALEDIETSVRIAFAGHTTEIERFIATRKPQTRENWLREMLKIAGPGARCTPEDVAGACSDALALDKAIEGPHALRAFAEKRRQERTVPPTERVGARRGSSIGILSASDAYVDKIMALIQSQEAPGQGIVQFIRKEAVKELGAQVLAAYNAIGGSARFIAAKKDGEKLPWLRREFSDAFARAINAKPPDEQPPAAAAGAAR